MNRFSGKRYPRRYCSLVWVAQLVLCVIIVYTTNTAPVDASAAGKETLIGVVGKDYIMLGADSSVSQSVVLTSSDIDKIQVIVDPFPHENDNNNNNQNPNKGREQQTIVVAAAGDLADADRFVINLRAHATIREFEAGIGCDVDVIDLEEGAKQQQLSIVPPGLSVSSVAKLARAQIAQSLRSASPVRLGVLVAGMQNEGTSTLSRDNNIIQSANPFAFISEDVQKQLQQLTPIAKQQEQVSSEASKDSVSQEEVSDSKKSALCPHLYWLDEFGSLQKMKYASHGIGSYFLLAILDQGYRENLSREQAVELIRDCFNQLQTRYNVNSPKPPIIKCVDANGCRRIV